MRPFRFERAVDAAHASRQGQLSGQGQTDAAVQFLAGGTTLIDLMKLDVLRPELVIDIGPLHVANDSIEVGADGLRLGAFAKMSTAADHPGVLQEYPLIAQSLQLAASAQLRNMATLGGNVLQKTRCTYYRDSSWSDCNKRNPGSGCAAIQGFNRNHAVLGVDETCISQYPGDFAVALVALGAQMELTGPTGRRRLPFSSLHTPLNRRPHIENTLGPGEIITAFFVPPGPWNRRSLYLKVRDRASYEFAISSAAVALDLDGQRVRTVRIGLGGVAYRPWRAVQAEEALIGKPLTESNAEAAAAAALEGATTRGYNDYKPELARRTLVHALLQAGSMRPAGVFSNAG
jgi:xanthine dehydrogenase YagS FAD-binding subunit